VAYTGFETVDRLILLAVTDRGVLDPKLTRELLGLPMVTLPSVHGAGIHDERIIDVVDEAVFLDQEEIESVERVRFDAALARLERSVEDRILIRRRRLSELDRRKRDATAERDRALSVETREAAERKLISLETESSKLVSELEQLQQRTEETYRKRRESLMQRRSPAPLVERIVDVGFEIS
jgi:hypothetical protein